MDTQHEIFPGIFVVPSFAQTILGIDPSTTLAHLQANYPVRGEGDAIVRDVVQWVDGDNVALKYRGRVLRRCKIWLQRGASAAVGFLRYRYTGWQWKVLPATVDVAMYPEVAPMADTYDAWCDANGVVRANHYIVTAYEDGHHSIGWHFDKPDSIDAQSLITVVKLGAHGRPFALRRIGETQPFFDEVLAPGTAVIMTMHANLATQVCPKHRTLLCQYADSCSRALFLPLPSTRSRRWTTPGRAAPSSSARSPSPSPKRRWRRSWRRAVWRSEEGSRRGSKPLVGWAVTRVGRAAMLDDGYTATAREIFGTRTPTTWAPGGVGGSRDPIAAVEE